MTTGFSLVSVAFEEAALFVEVVLLVEVAEACALI
jgi:hypothetical protein